MGLVVGTMLIADVAVDGEPGGVGREHNAIVERLRAQPYGRKESLESDQRQS